MIYSVIDDDVVNGLKNIHSCFGEVYRDMMELAVEAASSPLIDKAWGYVLFDVAQAMETHRYATVRDALDKLSAKFPGVTTVTEMDDDNVYITLRDAAAKAVKFVVLPREPATIGVWP